MDLPQTAFLNAKQFGKFSRLIEDYLLQKKETEDLYSLFPNEENLIAQTRQKLENYPNRNEVSRILKSQLSDVDLQPKQIDNLKKFSLSNSVTVTTGHQLNLLTGPLYFFYKILQTIKCCETLNAGHKEFNFIPVFWMATEDHDFAEINHFNYKNHKISWNRAVKGAVGRLNLNSIGQIFEEFEKILPPSLNANSLKKLIQDSYLSSGNLKEATQKLVQGLFGQYGLLMIDGDDKELKKLMIHAFEEDLLKNTAFRAVSETNEKLIQNHYSIQVNPREINLFYLGNGEIRERIIEENGIFYVADSDYQFTKKEILEELKSHPEKFSPNVILRPLYQETILPNIAYIGGSGEIAYWLQLKNFFESQNVLFPVLIVRNSVLLINEKQKSKLERLEIEFKELFKPLYLIVNENVMRHTQTDIDFGNYELQLREIFKELDAKAIETDVTFSKMVKAQEKKQLDGLEKMKKRLVKAERKKQSERVERIELIYSEIFPNGNLQERVVNFSQPWMEYGGKFVKEVLDEIHPYDFRFIIKTLP